MTNLFLNTDCFTGIIKTDISDNFPIFLTSNEKILENAKHITIRERVINEESFLYFKDVLHKVDWTHLYTLCNLSQTCSYFLRTFSGTYDRTFSGQGNENKKKNTFKSEDE